jgi:signal transduction histidine kinase
MRLAREGREIVHFQNGWYKLLLLSDGTYEYIAAILIQNTFPYQNKYLDAQFVFGFDQEGLISIDTKSATGDVKLRADHQPFYLKFDENDLKGKSSPFVYLLVSLLGGILMLLALFMLVHEVVCKYPGITILSFLVIFIGILRYWSLTAGWPGYISQLGFFSPAVYASSEVFASLADFLINTVIIAFIASTIRFVLFQKPTHTKHQNWVIWYSILVILLFLLGIGINHLVKGLVINSSIPYDINEITGLNGYSIAAIIGAAILYFSFYILAERTVMFLQNHRVNPQKAILVTLIVVLLHVLTTHMAGIRDLVFVLWPPITLLWVLYFRMYRSENLFRLNAMVLVVVIFAFVAGHNFMKYSITREHSQRLILSEKLAVDDDPVAELLYVELTKNIKRDKSVQKLFDQNDLHTRQTLEDFVIPRYFSGYWSKYQINMYAFLGDSSAWGKLPSVKPMPFSEILRKISENGEPTQADNNLFYLRNASDFATYIGVLPLHYSLSEKPDGFFVFEMSAKPFPQQIGFPALLIDESARTKQEASMYASARYVNGKLINSRGNYPYQNRPDRFLIDGRNNFFTRFGGYEHLVSEVDPSTVVIISRALKSPLDRATTFSYFCAIFGGLFALFRLGQILIKHKGSIEITLNQRIQLLLVFLTLASMLLFAFANRYYIEQKYTEKNRRQIGEKMQSVLLEVQNKLDEEEAITFSMSDYVNRLLSHFSYVFFTDIHLYSPNGDLVATSQMRMFNEGLVSRKMNPEAFVHLNYLDQTDFVHEERIGDLTYISAYTPFYNNQGELLAYLNLPYFAKQAELENEIYSFLVAIINIFVLLFILSILVGLFISQWITAPLRAIRESLAEIELGKTNKLIPQSGNDEIGLLVAEYNAKVVELEYNAEKLSQSERESAWREMAKQVAHEIKNPLTPMKLSVQHLERSLTQGQAVDREQIKRLSNNLVEQIDALSEIASAFSNFARMPVAKRATIDLVPIVKSAASLFDKTENVQIKVNTTGNTEALIKSDKEQMIRVFNNLIKNALQSIPDEKEGVIKIELTKDDDNYTISVSDNGTGIPEADYNRIFVPNFTTKSKGMGLGLAMTKNIVENSSGKIWFESNVGLGSTFYVRLPRA